MWGDNDTHCGFVQSMNYGIVSKIGVDSTDVIILKEAWKLTIASIWFQDFHFTMLQKYSKCEIKTKNWIPVQVSKNFSGAQILLESQKTAILTMLEGQDFN